MNNGWDIKLNSTRQPTHPAPDAHRLSTICFSLRATAPTCLFNK